MNSIAPKTAAPAARKASVSTVKAPSVRKETDKTTPYVLIRKPVKGTKVQRQIINVIEVGNTQEPSHVRPGRIAVAYGQVFGTNFPTTVSSLKGARVFAYNRRAMHDKSAKTIMPWHIGNQAVIEALHMLGLITAYELEFHNSESEKMEALHVAESNTKARAAKQKHELKALAKLAKASIAEYGVAATQVALRKVKGLHTGLF